MLKNFTGEIWTYAEAGKGEILTGLELYFSYSLDDCSCITFIFYKKLKYQQLKCFDQAGVECEILFDDCKLRKTIFR